MKTVQWIAATLVVVADTLTADDWVAPLALVQIGGPVDVFRIAKYIVSNRQDGIPHSGRSGIFEA
jgi:hypothetical protein